VKTIAALYLTTAFLAAGGAFAREPLAAEQARTIAREAYIYGFPMVEHYRVQHEYFIDRGGPEFKAPWNTIHNVARVFTPEDRAIQTPNSDTPYSQLGADLRMEPLVLSVPEVEKDRYYSLQFVDMFTFNFAYVGSRATGNEAGHFLLAGPRWSGTPPPGIKQVLRSETDFVFVLYRTQLKDPADIEGVKKIQAGYQVKPLSAFLGQPAPPAAPPMDFPKPIKPIEAREDLTFYSLLNFLLQFAPTHPSEVELRARFAKAGIEAGKPFDAAKLSPELRDAFRQGMADAWKAFDEFKVTQVDTGKRPPSEAFGTREFMKQDFLARMAGAVLGIYGNSKEEALYPPYFTDAEGGKLTGASRYELRFAKGQLPPANSFWSLTVYQLPESLLYANPLHRYLINSPMLPKLARDADGGLTLYIQHESPGPDKESNWLPVPQGPFWVTMRIYWPKPEALDGRWTQPPLNKVK
jgi:hypothetical protein